MHGHNAVEVQVEDVFAKAFGLLVSSDAPTRFLSCHRDLIGRFNGDAP